MYFFFFCGEFVQSHFKCEIHSFNHRFSPAFTRVRQKFVQFLSHVSLWPMWPKRFKLSLVLGLVGSIMISGALTHCALLHFVYDLKAMRKNMQCCQIWEFLLYEFKLCHKHFKSNKKYVLCERWKLITIQQPGAPRNFAWVAKTLTIIQGKVDLKQWISSLYSEPLW